MNNETPVCDFGLHRGEKYTEVPASFLNWMIEIRHEKHLIAKAELLRRENAVYNNHLKRK
jgi:hypothetical protein